MADEAFNFTLPATSNYYSLYDQIRAVPGLSYVPNAICELILCSDSATILMASKNYTNAPGVPVQSGGSMLLRRPTNSIDLKNIYLSGSGAVFSGWFGWI